VAKAHNPATGTVIMGRSNPASNATHTRHEIRDDINKLKKTFGEQE
jgi:hypothetical protein